ncbi:TPA: ATP-binding cassette domain-containing protein [Klebsiella pneumoniae]|nr:ATP-binding cassette domain-containing protein [Klebsiella pneumoniae]
MSASTPLLSLKGITKIFPGVRALENVQLDLWPGKVTALIGENGAGKSTLVKVMTGIYQPEEGEILYKAIPIHLPTPESAHKVGITAIHQETVLFDELSVSENIFVGQYLYKGLLKTLDWPAMHRRANEILTRLEVQIDPRATLKTLSIAQRHMVAIARALAFDAQVVILDEPTAALSQHEILEFYHIVERLKQDGKAILFISHKFDEIFELADYYTILRDGVYVSSGAISDITEERMVSMMVGRAISQTYPKVDCTPGETVLEVTDLCHPTEFAHISFRLRKGEILGFYGLVGAGRTELMQALSGVSRPSSGEIRLNGRTMRFHQPADAIRAGIVCVPEERQKQGAIIALPIAQNISLPQLSKLNPNGVLNDAREWRLADEYASRLQVKAFSWRQPVETLSGGNQQKVVIGKWLATQPEVIILDEPTKGIDIGSKAAVHQFMSELVSQGLAVVIILMIGAIGSRAPSFVSPGNLVEMFNDTAILIILALGQMMVLLTKGIDLSMAANLALTGMIVALINAHYPGIPVVALLALATLLGLLMGVINGLLVWRLGIPAIVVTLGTMSIYRGIIFLLTDGGWVNSHQMSADFLSLPRSPLLGLPLLSWCAIAALLLVGYFLRYSRTGRALYTAGGNATAAYYTGINAGKMQFVSFCLSGALAGFCGYLWISRFAVAYVDVANGFELQVVAACVIGGISTMGGSGRVLGCLCGALFLGVINNALPVIGISPFWQMAISGAVIVMAVLLNERGNRGHGRLILRNAALARQKQAVKS